MSCLFGLFMRESCSVQLRSRTLRFYRAILSRNKVAGVTSVLEGQQLTYLLKFLCLISSVSVSDLNTTADRRRCRKHGDSHIRRRSYRDLTDTRRYLSTAQRIMIQSRTSIQLPFPSSRGFDSRPFRFQTTTIAGCTQRCASVTKQYNLVPVKVQ